MSVTFDSAATFRALETLGAGLYNAAAQALSAAMDATQADAKATTLFKDKSGATRSSIKAQRGVMLTGTVSAGGVSTFLENGTRPHEIRANRAGALRFVINGRTVFARVVHHPGTAERPFMRHARDVGERTLEYGLDFFVTEAIQRA